MLVEICLNVSYYYNFKIFNNIIYNYRKNCILNTYITQDK